MAHRQPILGALVTAVCLAVTAGLPHLPAAQADAAAWSAAALLSSSQGAAPRAIVSADGSSVMGIWAGSVTVNKGTPDEAVVNGVVSSRRSATGSWSAASTFAAGGGSSFVRDVAASKDGTRAVVALRPWVGNTVWVASTADSGQSWSTPTRVDVPESGAAVRGSLDSAVQVAMSDDGSRAVMAWSYDNGENGNLIVAVTSSDGGATWTKEQEIRTDPIGTASSPTVDISSTGEVVLGWLEVESRQGVGLMRVRSAAGAWSTAARFIDPPVSGSLTTLPLVKLSADEDQVVAVYRVQSTGTDVWVRVGTVGSSGVSWNAPTSPTTGVEDLSFAESELDIDDTAAFRAYTPIVSANAQRIVLPVWVRPHAVGSASRAGAIVSTNGGVSWGSPVWLTSGRSDVSEDSVRASGSDTAMTAVISYVPEVYDPITCEEPSDECVPTDEPANGADEAEEGTWVTRSTDGGATWTPQRLDSVMRLSIRTSTASDGSVSAASWEGNDGAILWSSIGTPTAPVTSPPSAPRSVTVTRGDRSLIVSWTAPRSSGSSAVTTYRATAASGKTCTATAPKLTCTISGLTAGASYTVSVVAKNATHTANSGWGAAGTAAAITAATVPSAVASVSITKVARGSVKIAWPAPTQDGGASVTSYEIRYRQASGGSITTVGSLPLSPRSRTITGLVVGRSYIFTVYAVNSIGTGAGKASASHRVS